MGLSLSWNHMVNFYERIFIEDSSYIVINIKIQQLQMDKQVQVAYGRLK